MYKTSLNNLSVPYKDKVIYSNTLQESSFTLSPVESDRIAQQLKDPITFDLAFPSIFAQFKKWGFVTDEDLDEFALFRSRTIRSFFESHIYHLTVHCGTDGDIVVYDPMYRTLKVEREEGILELLKKHIDYVVKQWKAEEICLEFTGGEPLLQFNQLIEPLCKYTKRVCKDKQVKFNAQIETQGLRTASYAARFHLSGINAVKLSMEADSRRHNKVYHEKGMPTFQRMIEELISSCKIDEQLNCHLQINYEQNDSVHELQALLDSVPETLRSRIVLSLQGGIVETDDHLELQTNTNFSDRLRLDGFTFGGNLDRGGWQDVLHEHHGIRTVLLNGDLYFGRCELLNSTQKMGSLSDQEHYIEVEETEEYRAYGLQWFENDLCRKCKILPAVYPICAKACRQVETSFIAGICPLKRKLFTEESFVVQMFEKKSEFIAFMKHSINIKHE